MNNPSVLTKKQPSTIIHLLILKSMRFLTISFILLVFTSCTAVKLAVPEQFGKEATRHHVKGLQGWMINQQLSFGPYQTSVVKRGWDFSSAFRHTRMIMDPAEMVLKVFEIDTDKRNLSQRNKFQYTLYDGKLEAAVFATEKFHEKQLVYKSNNPWIGQASKTNRYEYAFTAAILPAGVPDASPWSLVMINKYDIEKDQSRGIFERPYVEEEGYATNGRETITLRPLRVDKLKQKNGRDTKVFGGALLTGYELKWDDGVVGIIDILDNHIWLANNLDEGDRLIISSIASAVMLKRMQDVEKYKDEMAD